MEAEAEAAKRKVPYERRHPLEVLWDALLGSDVVLQELLRKQSRGELTAEESVALGWAIDRAARTAKTAIDANLEARWLATQEQVAGSQAARLVRAMERFVNDPRVAVVGDPRDVIRDALRELNDPAPGLRVLPA
jgi:hypothetical protein